MKNKTVTTILTAAAITATTLSGTSLTFAEEIPVEEATEAVLTEETSETEQVDIEAAVQADMDDAEATETTGEQETEEELVGVSLVSEVSGVDIYVASQGSTGITAGMVTSMNTFYDMNDNLGITGDIEYHWQVYDCKTDECVYETDWILNNEWLQYTPEKPGDYILKGEANSVSNISESSRSYCPCDWVRVSYHPNIKGECQMPYTGEGGGYLIGVESYDNPNQEYEYEMLILDCTLLAEGKDAWTYSTGKCKVPETSFWTVWQPQYGYYWTLFRVYDKAGNLIDEDCYGFENTGRQTVIKPLDKYQQKILDDYNVSISSEEREYAKTEMKAYNYAVSTGVQPSDAYRFSYSVANDYDNLINKPGYEWLQGDTWLEGYETYFK